MSTTVRQSDGVTRHHGRAGSRRLAKICLGIVVFHLVMTALYLGPTPGPIRRAATAYMEPVFKQSWWVFAPDPVSKNTYLLVRAKKADGTPTPWFDVTECDIHSAILHHPVPDRRYLTTFQLMRHLEIARDGLPAAAKTAVGHDVRGEDWVSTLRQRILDAGASPTEADAYLKNNRAANNLLTLIAQSRWGQSITAIQLQERIVHTRPFSERNTNVPLKTEIWQPGFMPVTPGTAAETAKVDKLYGTKAGC